MHILITGGAGFIGSHIAEYHINKGDSVYVVDDLSTGSEINIEHMMSSENFQFVQANILTWDGLKKSVFWADRIYHMAAVVGMFKVIEEPTEVMAINVAGTERLLRFSRESLWSPQIIVASSSEVYGTGEDGSIFQEDNPLVIKSVTSSRWNYAISKLADEALVMSYYKKFNIKAMAVRFFNTIGPRQIGRYGMVVPRFVRQAVNNEPITVYGDGSQSRSFCDVRDTVVFLDQLAGNEKSYGQIINVGNNKCISIKDLAELIIKLTNSESDISKTPYENIYGRDYDEVITRKPDLKKLMGLTKYRHKFTLVDTINSLIEIEENKKVQQINKTGSGHNI